MAKIELEDFEIENLLLCISMTIKAEEPKNVLNAAGGLMPLVKKLNNARQSKIPSEGIPKEGPKAK